jgi:sugar phosphate isomerase/epimerase
LKLGIFTPVFGNLSADQMLIEVCKYDKVSAIELGTGGWPGASHVDVDVLLENRDRLLEFKSKIRDAGLIVSAFSCHGNSIHPDPSIAKRDDEIFRKTVKLAAALEVPTVVTFSGGPGAGPRDEVQTGLLLHGCRSTSMLWLGSGRLS